MIRKPEPGPTAAPLPEPVLHAVPRMADASPPPKGESPQVWRVTQVELDKLVTWLVPDLKRQWPRLSEEGVWMWFRAAIGDRRTLFVRTKSVVGMFHAWTDELEPWPIVIEKFVRWKQTANEEAVLLYQFAADWAKRIGAREMRFNEDSYASMQLHIAPSLQTFATPVHKLTKYSVTLRGGLDHG